MRERELCVFVETKGSRILSRWTGGVAGGGTLLSNFFPDENQPLLREGTFLEDSKIRGDFFWGGGEGGRWVVKDPTPRALKWAPITSISNFCSIYDRYAVKFIRLCVCETPVVRAGFPSST